MPALTLPEFVHRWRASTLTEKSGAQGHFIDLCEALGQPRPAAVDLSGAEYTFEKGVGKTGGGRGFADVWWRGKFAWEYKGQGKDLKAAYDQLLQYREDLENPPLLVVSDLRRFEVHTNFTGTAKRVYAFELADLLDPEPAAGTHGLAALDVLRALFTEPARLRPAQTSAGVTEAAAAEFARLAAALRGRGEAGEAAAHFLMRLLFCLFAEDIGLLPRRLFTDLVEKSRARPESFAQRIRALFGAMAAGGVYGSDDIPWFNGGLFADDTTLELAPADLDVLARAARLDWQSVEPAIFGTLFERSLDPAKRSQLGAHYTSKEDILLIVEPVLIEPLRRRWAEVQAQAGALLDRRNAIGATATPQQRGQRTTLDGQIRRLLTGFSDEIARVRVLDPACGSGNFLYVALKRLLDLEKEVVTFAASNGVGGFFPEVSPAQLHGIEINPYAHELAQIVVWIGYIQWLHDNGFGQPSPPILKPLQTIERKDAILAHDAEGRPVEPEWPAADVIIGNPPFLGTKKMWSELGRGYVDEVRTLYAGRVPGFADLVCYWFERARAAITQGRADRAGLIATNSIAGGLNRRVLENIKDTGDIFMAWRDRAWVVDGADVRVSMIGFDNGTDVQHVLDGAEVQSINSDLTSSTDVTKAQRLAENAGLSFIADVKGGKFDITSVQAAEMRSAPSNPNGRSNDDVVVPWVNGLDITRQPRNMWIIDFGTSMSESDASLYELPFEYVRRHVKPLRDASNRAAYRNRWWLHAEPGSKMRSAIKPLSRFIMTPVVSKYRLFVWGRHPTLPDHQLVVVARSDDYFLGVLQSTLHETWSLPLGTRMGVGNDPRYTPTTTFETFPFPWPPGREPADDPLVEAVAAAARALVEARDRWLDPEGASAAELKRRTLTNLYNARPTWLDLAHRRLDSAVLAAYGWPEDLDDEAILERLLALNLQRAAEAKPIDG